MIANDSFVAAFGSTPPGDEDSLKRVVIGAARAGFAVVLCKPGTKEPICTLNTRDRKKADDEAQDAARAAGDRAWQRRRHACGIAHAITLAWAGNGDVEVGRTKVAAKVVPVLKRVIAEYGGMPNLGVELGRSRMLVVDVDTVAEMAGFQEDWHGSGGGSTAPGMTVKSPGKRETDTGTWVHKDGGHYWFTIPDGVELPRSVGAYRADSGWVAMWADHQVLVPPSRRPEGEYIIVGQVNPAPEWLLSAIFAGSRAREERVRERMTRLEAGELPDGSGEIDVWSANHPWADLLVPDGWVDTGLPDRCSCPIFTAPGPHGSPKSATAHDVGCSHYDVSPGHGPLHVWTDNPPEWLAEATRRTGSRTFTKVQFVAWRDHDGVMKTALADLGLSTAGSVSGDGISFDVTELRPEMRERVNAPEPGVQPGATKSTDAPESAQNAAGDVVDLFGQPGAVPAGDSPGASDSGTGDRTPDDVIRSWMLSSAELDQIEDKEPLIRDVLDLDSVARMIGKSGHAKSFVALDMACSIATGKPWHGRPVTPGLVIYMVAEGSRGVRKRIRAWEQRHNGGQRIPDGRDGGPGLVVLPEAIQAGDAAEGGMWPAFRRIVESDRPVLTVLDTQARVTVGWDENDAKEMGIFVARLDALKKASGGCVLTVHHLGHSGEHGRGSTAVIGALDTEVKVSKDGDRVTVKCTKQKDQDEFSDLVFLLDPEPLPGPHGTGKPSVVLVPDGWSPDDYAAGDDVFGGPAPAPVEPPGVRLFRLLWKYLAADPQGFTGAQAAAVAKERTAGDSRPFGKSYFYKVFGELKRDGWVLPEMTEAGTASKTRFRLNPERADELGCPAPAVKPEREGEGEEPDTES